VITASQLNIKIVSEGAQQATADLRGVGNAVEATGQQSSTGAARIGAAGQVIRGVGAGMTAAITAPILALGVGIVGMASDTNEALNAVTNVYGTAAAGVIQSSQGAATAVGLSQTQYLSATTQLAAYGKMMGLTQGQTATFADQTVSAAADLASFYNTSPEDAMSAINAGFRGEGDALERYGIIMNQATVEQYALTSGIWDGNAAMTNAQLVQARSGFIMSQLTSETGSAHAAMGDFTETSGGLANQQRILKAELKDVGAQFGQVLLPVAMKMVGAFSKVIGVLKDMSPRAKTLTVIVAGIAAAIGPALIGIGAAMGPLVNGFRVARIAMLAFTGPIGLIVAGLVGLGIAYKTNFLGFGDAVRDVGSKIKDIFGRITDTVDDLTDAFRFFRIHGADPVQAALGALANVFPGLRGVIDPVASAIADFTSGFQLLRDDGLDPVTAALGALGMAFPALQDVINPLLGAVSQLKDAFAEDGLAGVLKTIPGLVLDAIAGLAGMALAFGGWVINVGAPALIAWVWDAAMGIRSWIEGELGIGPDAALARANEGGSAVPLTWRGWALGIGEAAISWAWDALTGIRSWIEGNLGIGTGGGLTASPDGVPTGGSTAPLTWTGWALGIGEAAISWIWDAVTGIYDWIKGNLGIGTGGGLAASPDGIPTGGSTEPLTWTGWALGVGEAAISWAWDAVTGIMDWIRTKLGVGSVAASPDGIPTGSGDGTIDWGDWGINVVAPAAGRILAAGWDFLTLVAGVIWGWIQAAGTYTAGEWREWTAKVGWATTVAATAWDFLTNVGGVIWGWITAAGTYTAGEWRDWAATIGWAASTVAAGAWNFLVEAGKTIWGWITSAGHFIASEWNDWTATLGKAATVTTDAIGVAADWLNPHISAFLNGVVLDALNWALSIGVPSNGIGLAADFNWTELAKTLFTGTIHLDPDIQMDIKKLGAKFGSWLNGALEDPATWKLIGIGVAALVAGVFFGPELLLAAGLALILPPAIEAFAAFFEGVFEGLDFGRLMDGLTTQLTDGLADMIDKLVLVLKDADKLGLVPDDLISNLEGWSDDIRGVGDNLGKDFRAAFTGAIAGDDPNRDNPGGTPLPGGGPVTTTGPDPHAGEYPDATASDPKAFRGVPETFGFAGGNIFGAFIEQAKSARTSFADVMTGITTSSDTAKTGVVAALTGMQTDGLPPVAGLSATSLGHLLAMQLGGNAQATAMQGGVSAAMTAMQLAASGSAGLTKDDVSTKLGTMKGTGVGHANALSAQTLSAFANLKMGATVAAGTTSNDVVTKLGTMATGGSAKATELMNNVKDRIRDSGAADTAYSVGYNVGSSLSSGLSAWLGTIQTVASDMIASVDRAMRKKAMISSPSKLFRQTGSYLGEGLVLGFGDWLDAAGQAGSQMISSFQSGVSSLGGFRDIAAAIQSMGNMGAGSGNRFYQGLQGVSRVSGAGTLNETSTTVADTMKVIADHFDAIFQGGEYGSDALTALPTDMMSKLAMALGKVMAPYEGNATVIESAYTALKNLVGDGAVRGAFDLVPDAMERGLVALAKNIRETFANGNLPIATNLYAVLRETNQTILTAMTRQATDFRAQYDANVKAGGPSGSKGAFGFGIANDAMAATLSEAGKQMLRAAGDYQNTYETSTNAGLQRVALDAVKRIGADFGNAGYSYRIFEDGSLVLDAVKALSAAAKAPATIPTSVPTPALPVQAPTSAPVSSSRPQATYTLYQTNNVTVSVKDAEEMVRLSRFVDDLPQAFSLVYGANGGAF